MRLLAAIAFTFPLALMSAPAAAEIPLYTWERIRDLAPEELALELFGEVGRSMYLQRLQAPESGLRPRLPLQWLSFLTRPRASYRAGVCETDWVRVEFREDVLTPTDLRVRPHRFEVSTQFIVQDLAKAREGGPAVDEMHELEAACAVIDPRDVSTIVANTAFEVTGAVGLLANLVDFARKGGTTGPLECTDADGTTMAAERCLADLAQLRPDEISYTTLSPGCDRHEVDIYCRDVGVQDYDNGVRITFELRRGAKVPQRIIVARERDLSQVVSTALSHR